MDITLPISEILSAEISEITSLTNSIVFSSDNCSGKYTWIISNSDFSFSANSPLPALLYTSTDSLSCLTIFLTTEKN